MCMNKNIIMLAMHYLFLMDNRRIEDFGQWKTRLVWVFRKRVRVERFHADKWKKANKSSCAIERHAQRSHMVWDDHMLRTVEGYSRK